jgi:hypothetical protein
VHAACRYDEEAAVEDGGRRAGERRRAGDSLDERRGRRTAQTSVSSEAILTRLASETKQAAERRRAEDWDEVGGDVGAHAGCGAARMEVVGDECGREQGGASGMYAARGDLRRMR